MLLREVVEYVQPRVYITTNLIIILEMQVFDTGTMRSREADTYGG